MEGVSIGTFEERERWDVSGAGDDVQQTLGVGGSRSRWKSAC
jgi:bifunctional ADP-heptose synthase (sugar kinase/adenylyltransferase)